MHLAVQGVLYCDKLFAYERSYKEKDFHINKSKNDVVQNKSRSKIIISKVKSYYYKKVLHEAKKVIITKDTSTKHQQKAI